MVTGTRGAPAQCADHLRNLPPVVFVELARLCLPLLLAVLDKELPGSRVTESLALLLAWVPAVFVIGFPVLILAYLLWVSTGARRR